jgi:hypothetical protein
MTIVGSGRLPGLEQVRCEALYMLTVYVSYLQGHPLTFQIAGELSY